MRFFYIIIVFVLFEFNMLFRDILNLPLHGNRSLIINMLFLLFAFVLYFLNESSKTRKISLPVCTVRLNLINFSNQSREYVKSDYRWMPKVELINYYKLSSLIKKSSDISCINYKLIIFILIPGVALFISSFYNESTDYFYLCQYIVLVALIQLFYLIALKNQEYRLIEAIYAGSLLFFLIIAGFYIINIFTNNLFLDITQKNIFPLFMIVMSVLCKKVNYPKLQRKFFIIGLLSAIVASTKLFFILIATLFMLRFFKIGNNYNKFSTSPALVFIHYLIIIIPFCLPFILSAYTGLSIDDLIIIGEGRHSIDDNISSLISRIYSVQSILQQENLNPLFGNNEASMAGLLFWGYPVHNLYASLWYAHGLILILILASYHLLAFRFFSRHFDLGVIFGFCLSYSNDILIIYSIFILPYFISICGRTVPKTQPLLPH